MQDMPIGNSKRRGVGIPVVLAFSPNYFVPAATCLYSILKHSENDSHFEVICLLSSDLSEEMKYALRQLDVDRINVSFILLVGRLKDIYVDERYTVAASYRLMLPELLPEYDKVLYIDCDVIVRNDLATLYQETDLGDYFLAAVFEATLDFQIEYLNTLRIKPGDYFNSGFLLMNLKKLRDENMTDKFLKASEIPGLQFPDQDVLNLYCHGRVLALPPWYNSIRTFYLPQYKNDFLKYYTQSDLDGVLTHGTVHYTGGKPWQTFSVQFGLWWQYYECLPEFIKSKWTMDKKMWNLYRIYRWGLGRLTINWAQQLYRGVRYKKEG